MTSEEDTVRPRFSLESEDEGELAGGLPSITAALTNLTILPSVSTADASWNMIGGADEGRRTPAAASRASSRARDGRGGLSVSSALTDAPSISSFSPFAGGFVGGGVVAAASGVAGGDAQGWRPSLDRHASGKSIPLLKIKNSKQFCLGWIGRDTHRFCSAEGCPTMSHRKKKHDLGCSEGWFIPTHSTGAFGTGPTCFLTPFLDDARLTDEVKAHLNTKNNTSWWRTTSEWEEYMMQAEVAWRLACPSGRGATQARSTPSGGDPRRLRRGRLRYHQ